MAYKIRDLMIHLKPVNWKDYYNQLPDHATDDCAPMTDCGCTSWDSDCTACTGSCTNACSDGCSSCSDCSFCSGCSNCSGCSDCTSGTSCGGCTNCSGCSGCSGCSSCSSSGTCGCTDDGTCIITIFSDVSQIRDGDLAFYKQILEATLTKVERREKAMMPQTMEELEQLEAKLSEALEELQVQRKNLK